MSDTTIANASKPDFLQETISLTQEFLSDILLDIQDMHSHELEHEFHWNNKLGRLTASISQFVEVTTLISKVLKARKNQSIADIKESHIQLLFIMKAINQAQDKLDYIALEELIKYELKDNLTQWKIDLMPQLKKLLNA